MNSLDKHYQQLLHFGLLNVREAVFADDSDWAKVETEFLHNLPSLIGEANLERHRYFWEAERPAYLAWVQGSNHTAARSRLAAFYAPIFDEMSTIYRNEVAPSIRTVSPRISHAG